MNDECGDVPYRLHLPRGSVREHDAGGRRNLDDADPLLIGVATPQRVTVMSEASIFGEGTRRSSDQSVPASGACCCPAHGLFGERSDARAADRNARSGRVQSNSSASFTART